MAAAAPAPGGAPLWGGRRCPALLCALLLLLLLPRPSPALAWDQSEKILLRDIQALTLHRDRFTTARRTAPIPQLQCLGGSAGCPAHIPEIVQCRNKGWDGFDVQWECKAELDTSYRFGKTAVSCEGYDYPDDPYVLRGSCGLEFNLELTEQGRKKYKDASGSTANGHGNSYGSNYFPGYVEKMDSPVPSSTRGLLAVVILLVLALGVYKLFVKAQNEDLPPPYTEHPQDHQRFFQASPPPPPPPPGFKSYFTASGTPGWGFGNSFTGPQAFGQSGPGFWTGLGTGGLLGYLFGNNRTTPLSNTWTHPAYPPPYFNTWNNPVPPSAPGNSRSSGSSSGSDTGTRTTSGFATTKRR
ncbi:store-operated calcium entry-associated regulatory factor isoform X1 [Macrotis lagotis]|uniref:store-operated calcium entry-associated regulatory factor isoform X1 n=1 Tax=Macrotis lagotis TaxID=92651 RepID=UPI003D6904AE